MAHLSPALALRGSRVRLAWRRGSGPAGQIVVLLAVGLLLFGVPSFTDRYVQLVGFEVFLLAALAQAWNLLAGFGGLVSLGSAAFVAIGSYTAAKLSLATPAPLLLAVSAGGVVAAAFAALVSVPLFRLRGIYFSIGTLALAEALAIWMVNWNALGGSRGMYITAPAPSPGELYELGLGMAVLTTAILVLALPTRLGIGLRGIRDNEDVAQQMGVPTFRTKLIAFTASAFLMGMYGGLEAAKLSVIEPMSAFSLQWTIDVVSIAIIGGQGTIAGPLLGAAFLVGLGEGLAAYPELHVAISGLILIVVIRFAPRGIWGSLIVPGLPALRRVRRLAR